MKTKILRSITVKLVFHSLVIIDTDEGEELSLSATNSMHKTYYFIIIFYISLLLCRYKDTDTYCHSCSY